MRKFTIVFVLLMSACATTGKYEEKLNSWVGHDISAYTLEHGAPARVTPLPNGAKVYTWYTDRTRHMYTYDRYSASIEDTGRRMDCQTDIWADAGGRILQYHFSGRACKAR